jgi:hypothetical protein
MMDFRHLRGFAKRHASQAPRTDTARRQRDYADTVEFLTSAPSSADTARKIVEAAALARAGGPARNAPTGVAAQILAAGERRRRPMGEK